MFNQVFTPSTFFFFLFFFFMVSKCTSFFMMLLRVSRSIPQVLVRLGDRFGMPAFPSYLCSLSGPSALRESQSSLTVLNQTQEIYKCSNKRAGASKKQIHAWFLQCRNSKYFWQNPAIYAYPLLYLFSLLFSKVEPRLNTGTIRPGKYLNYLFIC